MANNMLIKWRRWLKCFITQFFFFVLFVVFVIHARLKCVFFVQIAALVQLCELNNEQQQQKKMVDKYFLIRMNSFKLIKMFVSDEIQDTITFVYVYVICEFCFFVFLSLISFSLCGLFKTQKKNISRKMNITHTHTHAQKTQKKGRKTTNITLRCLVTTGDGACCAATFSILSSFHYLFAIFSIEMFSLFCIFNIKYIHLPFANITSVGLYAITLR